jgi:hypothetical protein
MFAALENWMMIMMIWTSVGLGKNIKVEIKQSQVI